jgi:hypothetical protein
MSRRLSMQLFPSAEQSFDTVRNLKMLYVDKTEYIWKLIKSDGCFFLSRPSRFGKSLLLDTMRALFEGHRELFHGLWLGSSGYDFKPYPVVSLSLVVTDLTMDGIRDYISVQLFDAANINNVDLEAAVEEKGLRIETQAPGNLLAILVNALMARTGQQAVVLIDEYDAPIQSVITETGKAEQFRDMLHDFYSVLEFLADKDKIKFLFVTGITRLAKSSFFSVFNNCVDLTLDPEYAGICGFTLAEFDACLAPLLPAMLEYNRSKELVPASTDLDGFRRMVLDLYGGYSWDGETRILNPYSLIQFFKSGQMENFWYESGTPAFLFDLIRQNPTGLARSDSYRLSLFGLSNVDIANLSLMPLLFQTGYLTIDKQINAHEFILREPNSEVAESFNLGLLLTMTDRTAKNIDDLRKDVGQALRDADPALLARSFEVILDWFPFRLNVSLEYYYRSIVLPILKMLGHKVMAEVDEALAVIYLVLEYSAKRVYMIEIKFAAPGPETMETKAPLECGLGATDPAKTRRAEKSKLPRWHGRKTKTILKGLLDSAREQIWPDSSEARYGDAFETVHRVAISVADRTCVAVEIW